MTSITPEDVSFAADSAGLTPLNEDTALKLSSYGNLLLRWNRKTNLIASREPAVLLHRHIIESVAAAQALPKDIKTLLDFGSGAGLPGIPIAISRPELKVTLAESQSKKLAFLREAVRSLPLSITIHPGRVEQMDRQLFFDCVTMRAVDRMLLAIPMALHRIHPRGKLVLFSTNLLDEPFRGAVGKHELRWLHLPLANHLLEFEL